jgi:hypothetical protein
VSQIHKNLRGAFLPHREAYVIFEFFKLYLNIDYNGNIFRGFGSISFKYKPYYEYFDANQLVR